jgi:hypothetical protein
MNGKAVSTETNRVVIRKQPAGANELAAGGNENGQESERQKK